MEKNDELVATILKIQQLIEKLKTKEKYLTKTWMDRQGMMSVDSKIERFKKAMERKTQEMHERRSAAHRKVWSEMTEERRKERINNMQIGRLTGQRLVSA